MNKHKPAPNLGAVLADARAVIAREEAITVAALAETLGRMRHTVYHWIAGRGRPDESAARQIRSWLRGPGVSNPPADTAALMSATGERFARARTRTKRGLAAHLGVNDRTVRRWLSGEDTPAPAMVRRIAAWTADAQG